MDVPVGEELPAVFGKQSVDFPVLQLKGRRTEKRIVDVFVRQAVPQERLHERVVEQTVAFLVLPIVEEIAEVIQTPARLPDQGADDGGDHGYSTRAHARAERVALSRAGNRGGGSACCCGAHQRPNRAADGGFPCALMCLKRGVYVFDGCISPPLT